MCRGRGNGNQPFVVGSIVPCRDIRRQEGDQLLVELQRLAHLVGLYGQIAFGVD